ncbi:conserved Plasmodium protein, unknown function [Plasmodium berghei]|uniref:Nucleoporin NUP138 n=2 Tax=Plasmodium berghei TaxID=5821 RepID=A0A509AFD3_PLABA|nr:nucleoporin NUP138 [Plasmodium berghei ANKA]CXI04879.1 conserved Plasmodium protein, unknown function [Plasmodium berghei]SCL92317.1 conserved Plasmodium protein, unknown function [Plasmodium berghei]SCM15639.1 conserved Plasmodium protein, unknown function [Plasmodium berghei]SCM17431.1 conserved Plasmodium protein, unknown function [Plasmodium berghei]SCN22738.1 conserved Plasmodium protein, unknown function [Plasmodium berghei]|eukprot:XP_034420236.1 nucleoporin NUP138 [Plasmodium berghei ANKA]
MNNNGGNANNPNMWGMPNNNLGNNSFFGTNMNSQNGLNENNNNSLNNQTNMTGNNMFFGASVNNQNNNIFENNMNSQNNVGKSDNSIFGTPSNDLNKSNNTSLFGSLSSNTSVNNNTTNAFNANLFNAAKKDVYPGFTRSLLGNSPNNSSNIFKQSTLGSSIALGSQLNEDRGSESGGLFSKEQLEAAKQIFANSSSGNLSSFNNKTNNNKLTFSGGFSSSSSAFSKNNINPFQSMAMQATNQNDKSSLMNNNMNKLFFGDTNNNNINGGGKINPFGMPTVNNLTSPNKLNEIGPGGFSQAIKSFNPNTNSLFSSQTNTGSTASTSFNNNDSSQKSLFSNFGGGFNSFAKTNTNDIFKKNTTENATNNNNTNTSFSFLPSFNGSKNNDNSFSLNSFNATNNEKSSGSLFSFNNNNTNTASPDFSLFSNNNINKTTTPDNSINSSINKDAENKAIEKSNQNIGESKDSGITSVVSESFKANDASGTDKSIFSKETEAEKDKEKAGDKNEQNDNDKEKDETKETNVTLEIKKDENDSTKNHDEKLIDHKSESKENQNNENEKDDKNDDKKYETSDNAKDNKDGTNNDKMSLFGKSLTFNSSFFKTSTANLTDKKSNLESSSSLNNDTENKKEKTGFFFGNDDKNENTNTSTESKWDFSKFGNNNLFNKEKESFSFSFKETSTTDKKNESTNLKDNKKEEDTKPSVSTESKDKNKEATATPKKSIFNFGIKSNFLNQSSKDSKDDNINESNKEKDNEKPTKGAETDETDADGTKDHNTTGVYSKLDSNDVGDKKKIWKLSFTKKKDQTSTDAQKELKENELKNNNLLNKGPSLQPSDITLGKGSLFGSFTKDNEKKNEDTKNTKSDHFSNINSFGKNNTSISFNQSSLFGKPDEKGNTLFSSSNNTFQFFNSSQNDKKKTEFQTKTQNIPEIKNNQNADDEDVNNVSNLINFISLEDRKKNVYINNNAQCDDENHEKTYISSNLKSNNNNETSHRSQTANFQLKETKGTLRMDNNDDYADFNDIDFINGQQNLEINMEHQRQLENDRKSVENNIKTNECFLKKNLDQEMAVDVINNLSSFVKNKINFMNYCSNEILDIYNKVSHYEKMYALISEDQIKIEKKQESLEKRLRLIQSEQCDMLSLLNELDNENSLTFLKVLNQKNLNKDDSINNKNLYLDIDKFEKLADKIENLEELIDSIHNTSKHDIVNDLVNKCYTNEINCEQIEKQLNGYSHELRNMK